MVDSPKNIDISDPYIGVELEGTYQIVELIGAGGWGNVYRAISLSDGKNLAVKILHKHHMQDEASIKRFALEAKLLSRIENPNIIRTISHGLDPSPYIIMEYFDGTPLNKWLKDNGPMNPNIAIDVFLHLCDGLSAAEKLRIVHRDLKPANVLLNTNGDIQAKILDFGLAKFIEQSAIPSSDKLTATGDVLGSPAYMPPEQWRGQTDNRSDIYALGCIMYEVLAGRPAFTAQFGIDYLNKHLTERPARISDGSQGQDLPASLEDIVSKCMQKAPANRYQDSAAISADLKKVKLGRSPVIVLAETKKAKNKKTLIIVGTVAAAILLICMLSERLLIPCCDAINLAADNDMKAGRLDEAIKNYRQTLNLAHFLPYQDKRKLHAIRKLILLEREKHEFSVSSSLEKELAACLGATATPEIQSLLNQAYFEWNKKNNLTTAGQLFKKAQVLAVKKYGEHSALNATLLNYIGDLLRSAREAKQGLPYQLKALKIAEDLEEPDSYVVAECLNNLGLTYFALHQYDNAEPLFKQALSMNQGTGRQRAESTTYNNLGLIYGEQGKSDLSIQMFLKSIERGGTYAARSYTNIATMYERKRDYDAAIKYSLKALERHRQDNDDKNPETIVVWNQLALCYYNTKDFKKAESSLEEGRKLVGTDSRDLHSMWNYRYLYATELNLGNEEKCKELQNTYFKLFGQKLQMNKDEPLRDY